MGHFSDPAVVQLLDDCLFKLVEPVIMPLDENKPDNELGKDDLAICVPAGFVTDLASVPRVLWSVLPPHGRYAKAAIVHDYLLSNCEELTVAMYKRQRTFADRLFFLAMLRLGVKRWKAEMMYRAVSFETWKQIQLRRARSGNWHG